MNSEETGKGFDEDIRLVWSHVLAREHGIDCKHLSQVSYRSRLAAKRYFKTLEQSLSIEDARLQSDEILQAAIEKRPWNYVVKLTKPVIRDQNGVIIGKEKTAVL